MRTELPYHRPGCDHDGPCWTVSYDDCWGISIKDEHHGDRVSFSLNDIEAVQGIVAWAIGLCHTASRQRERDDAAEAAEDAAAEKEEAR